MSPHISRHIRGLALTLVLASVTTPAIAKTARDTLVAAGKPVNCIPLHAIRSTDIRDSRTIDFVLNGNKVYRNTLPHSCPSLAAEKRFLYKTSISQLCSVDVITVLYSSPDLMRGPSCGLGAFQPMVKAAK